MPKMCILGQRIRVPCRVRVTLFTLRLCVGAGKGVYPAFLLFLSFSLLHSFEQRNFFHVHLFSQSCILTPGPTLLHGMNFLGGDSRKHPRSRLVPPCLLLHSEALRLGDVPGDCLQERFSSFIFEEMKITGIKYYQQILLA